MRFFINLAVIFIGSFLVNTVLYADQKENTKGNLKVISIYQIEDESSAGFDFFTSRKTHKCGGKLSNRYRSYSDYKAVNERKFQLVLAALKNQYNISIKPNDCEGSAMLVDYIGISQ